MIFNWEDFRTHKIAVHCKTEQECNNFLEIAEKHGLVCGNNVCPLDGKYFKEHGNNICYGVDLKKHIKYESVLFYSREGRTILEWSDYMEFTKDDTKVGMLVEVDYCARAIVMPTKSSDDILVFDDSRYIPLDFDRITKVWGLPSILSQVIKFNAQSRDLLYERDDFRKMTVEEISKALGYKVKIVKS